jgi:hypothetical protein
MAKQESKAGYIPWRQELHHFACSGPQAYFSDWQPIARTQPGA